MLDKSEEVSLSKMLIDKYEEIAEASQNNMEILRKVLRATASFSLFNPIRASHL